MATPTVSPYDAKYYEQLANLKHQEQNALSGDQASSKEAESGYNYSTGQLDTQLPVSLRETRNTANNQGLLESGVLGQRAGSVEAKYATSRARLTTELQEKQDRIHENEKQAAESRAAGESSAATEAIERQRALDEQNAVNDSAPAPAVPAPPASKGPVVVSQKLQPATVRKAAAKRVTKK